MVKFEKLPPKEEPEAESHGFEKEKQKMLDFVKGKREGRYEFERPIDNGIKPLVEKLNKLKFLYTTTGSCEGHVVSAEDVIRRHPNSPRENLRLPPDGFARYYPGYLHIAIDGSSVSNSFLKGLRAIIAKYPSAKIEKMSAPVEKHLNIKNGFDIYFDVDDRMANGKKKATLIDEAKEMERVGKLIIKDLEDLVDSYINQE